MLLWQGNPPVMTRFTSVFIAFEDVITAEEKELIVFGSDPEDRVWSTLPSDPIHFYRTMLI